MNPLDILILILLSIGCSQGIFLGLQIGLSKPLRYKNRFLGILLLLFSYRLLNEVLLYFGIGQYDTWYHLSLELSWAYGALIYLYVKARVQPNYRWTRQEWQHFIPLGIQIIASVFVRSQNFFWDGTRESLSWLGYWGYVAWRNYPSVPFIASLLIFIYLQKSWRLIQSIDPEITDQQQLRFLRGFLRKTRLFYGLVLGIYLLDFFWIKLWNQSAYYYFTRFFYNPFLIGISLLTYWLSFAGYRQRQQTLIIRQDTISNLEKSALKNIAQQLEVLMQKERLYTKSDLSLNELADKLDTKPYLLSNTFKYILNSSFYDYINQQRIEAFKALLLDPLNDQYSLLGLAYNAGFNSKSSFQRAIKKQFGMTPSEFKEQLLAGSIK